MSRSRIRPTMARSLAFLLLGAGLFSLGGCAVNPATGERMFAIASPAEEVRIGRQQHPKLVKEFGGAYEDAQVARYVSSIGRLLATTSELPNLRFTFTVLNTGKVNAFALPGGYVYVTRGLLALANTEAQLAGVIAHEIGHVSARHAVQRYSRSVAAGIGLTVLGVLTGSPALARAAGLGAQIYLQGYSRDQELEADTLGIRYLRRAGYDSGAMADFLRRMRAQAALEARIAGLPPGKVDEYSILATHPRTIDRVQQAAAAAANIAVPNPIVGREVYLRKIDGMVFGDAPDQGLIRGRVFAHPALRFTFTAPAGFRLINTPTRVLARGPGKARIIFDRAEKRTGRSLTHYLQNVWARGVRLAQVERININGMDAATGAARVKVRRGAVDVRLVAIRYDPERVYRFAFLIPPRLSPRLSLELRRTTHSFRRLSAAEAAGLKPLRIRVVRVGAGDTVASLAARMPYSEHRRERFEVLNGLAPGARLRPGEFVKIIAAGDGPEKLSQKP